MVNYYVHKQTWAQIIVFGTTNAPTGRVDRNWTESGGKAPHPEFLLEWLSSRKSHINRRRGHLRVAISATPDPSGSGGVSTPTRPVATAWAAVATGASGQTDTRHISDVEVWEPKLYFYPSAGGKKKTLGKPSSMVTLPRYF